MTHAVFMLALVCVGDASGIFSSLIITSRTAFGELSHILVASAVHVCDPFGVLPNFAVPNDQIDFSIFSDCRFAMLCWNSQNPPINDDVRWDWIVCPAFCLRDESAAWKSSSFCMSKCGAFMTGCFSPPLPPQALVSQPVLSDAEVINETFASYYSNKAPC